MCDFKECITELIKKDIAGGLNSVEALEKAGAKKLDGCDSIYYIGYGLYNDKALFFRVQNES